MHELLSNNSVTQVDFTNVTIIEDDLLFLNKLYKKRPDVIITGLPSHVRETLLAILHFCSTTAIFGE